MQLIRAGGFASTIFSIFILFFNDIIPLTRSIGDDIRGLRLSITGGEMSFPEPGL
jgi:hypothetical protein